MKKFLLFFLIFFLSSPFMSFGRDVDIGVSISNGQLRSFYFSLSDYYRVPEEKIIIIKKRYPVIIEDELPILLLIIREARVEPDIIIQLRQRGYSWYDIMIRFKIYPEVVFKRYIIYGPPYGKAWGYHKKKKVFDDKDIIILSNIKFLSEYYHEDPQVIIKYKEKYPRFIDVHKEIYELKKEKRVKPEEPRGKNNGKFERDFEPKGKNQRDFDPKGPDRDFDKQDRGKEKGKHSDNKDFNGPKEKRKDKGNPVFDENRDHPGKGRSQW